MLRYIVLLAVIIGAGAGFYIYSGDVKDKLAGALSDFRDRFNSDKNSSESGEVVGVTIKILSGLDNNPMEGLEVSNGKVEKFTDTSGNVVFYMEVNKTYYISVSSGWSPVPIYNITEPLVIDDETPDGIIYTIVVYPRGSFLPLNVISLDDPRYSSVKGVVRVPENFYGGAWLLNVGTSSYIAEPCITLSGNLDIIKDMKLVRVTGRIPPIDTGGVSLKNALSEECILLKEGMTSEDLTIFRLVINFEGGSGAFDILLKDKKCEECKPEKVSFVKGL